MINRTAVRVLVVVATVYGALIPLGWSWTVGVFVFWSAFALAWLTLIVAAAHQSLQE